MILSSGTLGTLMKYDSICFKDFASALLPVNNTAEFMVVLCILTSGVIRGPLAEC